MIVLAQAAGYSLVQWLIIIIVIAAAVGICLVALRYFGITIPQPIMAILCILAVAALAIVSIKLLVGLL